MLKTISSALNKTNSFIRCISKQCLTGTSWSPEKEKYTIKEPSEIIREHEIFEALVETRDAAKDKHVIRDILKKAKDRACMKNVPANNHEFILGIDFEDAATLLNVETSNSSILEEIFETSFFIKNRIYGNRIVLFAPLYVANYCNCTCTYCGYRCSNKEIPRTHLDNQQVMQQVVVLEKMGHKRILMLTGESPEYTFDQFLSALKAASSVKTGVSGEIRRINVEIPPLSVTDMKRLKAVGCVGTFTVFQETYHRKSYAKYHPYGPKADYDYRLTCMDRANLGGIDDVGIGALLGLYDHKFEALAMLQHSVHLDSTYGSGPHTISFPRLRPASNSTVSENPKHPVNDDDYKRLIAVMRCAVPYTGMIISTRESEDMRSQLLKLGISQISAASSTEVGAYEEDQNNKGKKGQFTLFDHRSADEIVYGLLRDGYVPSWCTACYRLGRTGETFMKWAKSGEIHCQCHPNSLFTLAEYLFDYAKPETQKLGWQVIDRELLTINDEKKRESCRQKLELIKKGARDIYV